MRPATKTDAVVDQALEVIQASETSGARPQRHRIRARILTDRAFRPTAVDPELSEAAISPVWEDTSYGIDLAAVNRYWAVHSRDAVFRRTLAVADVAGAYAALLLAAVTLGHGTTGFRLSAVLVAPLIIVASKAIGLYDRDQHILRKTTIDELPSILHLSVFYALAVWLSETFLARRLASSRPQVLQPWPSAVSSSLPPVAWLRGTSLSRSTPEERCIVLGNAADAERTASKLAGSPGVKATVVGRVTLDDSGRKPGIDRQETSGMSPPWSVSSQTNGSSV